MGVQSWHTYQCDGCEDSIETQSSDYPKKWGRVTLYQKDPYYLDTQERLFCETCLMIVTRGRGRTWFQKLRKAFGL